MKHYNLRQLMVKAWSLFRKASKKGVASFSDCLKLAWRWLKVQAANRVKVEQAAAAAGYGDVVCHSWYGWRLEGREVCHTERAAFKVQLQDPTTKAGTRWESFFSYEQTFARMAE